MMEGFILCIVAGHHLCFALGTTSGKASERAVELVVKIDNGARDIFAPFALRDVDVTNRALDLFD
jgi:hypothetical protein